VIYQKFDTDIAKISIFPRVIRHDTIYRYRIDISIFSIYRSSTTVSFTIFDDERAWQDRVSQHNTRPARPWPRPISLVWERSCPKTDGLRPHHCIIWPLNGFCCFSTLSCAPGGGRSAKVESQWDSFRTRRSRFLLNTQQLPVRSRLGALHRRHFWSHGLYGRAICFMQLNGDLKAIV